VDCDLARRLLPFARPGTADLEAADRAALDRHVANCSVCAASVAADLAFDAGLSRAMRAVPVPDAFHARLTTRLTATRWAFYRRFGGRLLLAGLALAVSWTLWTAWRRPTLDPTAVAMQTYELSGQGKSSDEAREAVRNWLRTVDGRLDAPDEFNYRLFTFGCLSDFQGLTGVPTLVFARGEANCRAYAVREGQFKDLAAFRESVEVGGCTVEARRYPSLPGWVFVVVTSGGPPDDFRRANRPLDPA
jgi:hypothetical protein